MTLQSGRQLKKNIIKYTEKSWMLLELQTEQNWLFWKGDTDIRYKERVVDLILWPHLEKQLLSILYACERFTQEIYRQTMAVGKSHRYSINYFIKSLNGCTLQNQRMMVMLQNTIWLWPIYQANYCSLLKRFAEQFSPLWQWTEIWRVRWKPLWTWLCFISRGKETVVAY